MKTTPRFTSVFALLLLFLGAISSAQATFVFTLSQVGSNVVVNGSGTFDLTNFGAPFSAGATMGMAPSLGNLDVGPAGGQSFDVYSGLTGPASFGSGGNTVESSGTGAPVALNGSSGILGLPVGYVSGTLLTDSGIFSNATFASLGFTPGTYTYTWGTGPHADSLVVTTAAPTVPDGGSTALLLGFGLTGLCAVRRALSRRKLADRLA